MISTIKEFIKANFKKYFPFFVAYLLGIMTAGLAQYLR